MVVVVNADQVTELQVTSCGSSLAGNTLHGASIAEEAEGVVVDELVAWLVVDGSRVCLGNSKTNGVAETLAKRASSDLNTWGIVGLWMTWSDAVDFLDGVSVSVRKDSQRLDRSLTRKDFRSSMLMA